MRRVHVGTGRDGQGRDGPWKGAAELRRKRTRGVSKSGGAIHIRLDAAALERRARGLASGGDGWAVDSVSRFASAFNEI